MAYHLFIALAGVALLLGGWLGVDQLARVRHAAQREGSHGAALMPGAGCATCGASCAPSPGCAAGPTPAPIDPIGPQPEPNRRT